MKLRSMLLFFAMAFFSVQTVQAACYTCTVTQSTDLSVSLTDTGGAFTARDFVFPSTTTVQQNRYLAIVLTALASGKQITACMNSTVRLTPLTAIAIKQ
ncbi:hypothetical protein G3N56_14520 [Desulfovibrio sulfodismutans]|uniref:Secreted protein n=1 Tax=Desulfolutivibrio sulfodismutans TaxID=63561 RepID=A0A7K3NPA1_9BACT|nr:hypothetical protein [Desulfolutivibrio sulfodismutans]NDY57947.1 hypothetical protein [Desulfolutivibrio sulfodismutans]QLA14617.1 hypothetical protein GD606_19920 [Desulfolutivibrio sulfodismutans DSM 3696]